MIYGAKRNGDFPFRKLQQITRGYPNLIGWYIP